MKNYKVRVTEKCRGELTLRSIKKSLRRNWVAILTEEEFSDPDTQIHLRAGNIELLGDEKTVVSGKYFESKTHRILTLSNLNRIVNQNVLFFVNKNDLDDPQLNDYIERGWIEEIDDNDIERKTKKATSKKTASKKATSKKTASKKTASKKTASKKTASKKTASKKTTSKKTTSKKTTSKKATSKPTLETKLVTAEDIEAKNAIPDGMYAHIPEGSDAPKAVRAPRGSETIIDLDLNETDDTVSFVDNEQENARKLPVAKTNSEVE